MKKIRAKVFLVAALGVFAICGAAIGFSGAGSGTQSDPFVITNIQQLQEMNDDLGACYELDNDIDASATQTWNSGEGFVPVGTHANRFKGTFDGRGFSIHGLRIDRIDGVNQGLFGKVHGALIKNVNLIDASLRCTYAGGCLVGSAVSESVIIGCSVTGTVTLKGGSADSKSGGLIGGVGEGSRVEQCFSGVDVNADRRKQVGSLMGYLRGRGYSPKSLLTNSYSYGTVTGNGSKQGNLLGDADGSRVDRCYSCGYGKALIGYNYAGPVITNCYWDKDKGASSSSYGGKPRTTAQMMQQATFVNWDFVEVWDIVENETYPFLRVFTTPVVEVAVDIKPGSCRNPLNLASHGVLPVAILGTEDFDVNTIDIASIRLADVAPIRSGFEDVAAPAADGNECGCSEAGPDGYTDLTLKFNTQQLVEALAVTADDLVRGDVLILTLTGVSSDGTRIEGADCVSIVGKVPKSTAAKRSDINADGRVNMLDFVSIAENWLQSTF